MFSTETERNIDNQTKILCSVLILLILVGVELPLRVCLFVTILECCVTFSGVKLSIRSFVLFNQTFELFWDTRQINKNPT